MTPTQALQILKAALVTRHGLSMQEVATVLQAWNIIAAAIAPPPEPRTASDNA